MLHLIALLKVSSAAHALMVEVPNSVPVHVVIVVHWLLVRLLLLMMLLLRILVWCAIV